MSISIQSCVRYIQLRLESALQPSNCSDIAWAYVIISALRRVFACIRERKARRARTARKCANFYAMAKVRMCLSARSVEGCSFALTLVRSVYTLVCANGRNRYSLAARTRNVLCSLVFTGENGVCVVIFAYLCGRKFLFFSPSLSSRAFIIFAIELTSSIKKLLVDPICDFR